MPSCTASARLSPAPFVHCLPCRPTGVRLEPITWAELSELIADGSESALGTLGRTPLQVRAGIQGSQAHAEAMAAACRGPVIAS